MFALRTRRLERAKWKIDDAGAFTSAAASHAVDASRTGVVANGQSNDGLKKAGPFTQKTQSDLMGEVMYRIFVIAGLGALAIVVTVGQLGPYLHDDKAAGGQHQDTRHVQQDFLNVKTQQRPRNCYHCAISLAGLSLSDATFDGVTITNHSKNTLEEITFEVTMKDCPPGYNPATANSADGCVIVEQESKGVDVFIPPGQARGFHSRTNFHDVPLPSQSRRFFSWRIVSAKGIAAP